MKKLILLVLVSPLFMLTSCKENTQKTCSCSAYYKPDINIGIPIDVTVPIKTFEVENYLQDCSLMSTATNILKPILMQQLGDSIGSYEAILEQTNIVCK